MVSDETGIDHAAKWCLTPLISHINLCSASLGLTRPVNGKRYVMQGLGKFSLCKGYVRKTVSTAQRNSGMRGSNFKWG
jgi:hypothetical protein